MATRLYLHRVISGEVETYAHGIHETGRSTWQI